MAFSGYTCFTCAVVFASAELQRAHYKTDWHRYNLKRKVAELPPVTVGDFKQRVFAQRDADTKARECHSHYCEVCKKAFASDKSFESHLRSKKHKDKQGTAKESDDGISEVTDVTEGTADEALVQTLENLKNLKIELTDVSIGDERERKKIETALQGLPQSQQGSVEKKQIGEASPKKEDAVGGTAKNKSADLEDGGLSEDSDGGPEPLDVDECLFCPVVSENMEACLRHMSSAHGFFIPDLDYLVDLKGFVEYLGHKVGEERSCLYCQTGRMFYSIEAIQHHMVDKAHCKLFFEGDSALEYAEFYDYTKSYAKAEEKQGESKEDDEDLPVPDNSLAVNEDLELVLPSGSKLSHRSMKQYYKQRLPTLEHRTSTVVTRLMAQYRAIGWKGAEGEGGRKRVMDVAWRHRMQQKRQMKLSIQANKLQHHFRPQVIF